MALFSYVNQIRRSNRRQVNRLIAQIKNKYSQLDFNLGEFSNLSFGEKLPRLIELINSDSDIHRLHNMMPYGIGGIVLKCVERVDFRGKSLGIDCDGLYIYEWEDPLFDMPSYMIKSTKVRVTKHSIKTFIEDCGHVELRQILVNYLAKHAYNAYREQQSA